VTRSGLVTAVVGAALAALGWVAAWPAVTVVGAGLLVLVLGALAHVSRRPRLALRREIEPPRVEKGSPAVAVVHATNLSRRTLAPLDIEQRLGDLPVTAVLPRLRRGEAGLRTYRLPTTRRGIYDVGPVEVRRSDPFGLCRTVLRLGEPQRIAVHPRLARLDPLPTGTSRNLEGPSTDLSPQGTITFHRLREYVVGDDLRTVHWPTTARLGRLVVRHNVDTAQPYSVVLVDVRPSVYSEDTFETAIDMAASLATSLGTDRAPVQLRTTAGAHLGGPGLSDADPIVDFLTAVAPDPAGSLRAALLRLRRDRTGTSLSVVTGRLDLDSLPLVDSLRRRFDRVVLVSVVPRPGVLPATVATTVLAGASLDELAAAWNHRVAR
jgi:uncharacterized protein (DUF58 family)